MEYLRWLKYPDRILDTEKMTVEIRSYEVLLVGMLPIHLSREGSSVYVAPTTNSNSNSVLKFVGFLELTSWSFMSAESGSSKVAACACERWLNVEVIGPLCNNPNLNLIMNHDQRSHATVGEYCQLAFM